MEEIGVQAVVKGLSSFLSDLRQVNTGLKGVQNALPKGNLFTSIFTGAANVVKSFGREVLNVAEYALGHLLADSIQFVAQKMGELAQATIQAGGEFQTMELRLNRLNMNTIIEQTGDYTNASKLAKEATQDQLQWILKLAATTPYDAQDIANVYTLARSYGFAGKQAQGLTKDISDFAAGMGLGNTEIERIIVNFGQMVQQGKVTSREMNDLARGAFVPVNDVLKRMQENVGLTDKEFAKFRQTGEGVQAFMEAFSQIVEERFSGAAEDMARTFQGATANAQDFVKSIFGFNVVKPVLDVIGGRIADILTELTKPGTFEQVSGSAKRFGLALQGLVGDLLGIKDVDTASIVEGILDSLDGMTTWVNTHKDEILQFFKDVQQTISDVWAAVEAGDFGGFLEALGFDEGTIDTLTGLKDKFMEAFNTISGWVDENGPTINEFFSTLGEIAGDVISDLTGGEKGTDTGGGLSGFLDGITTFMQYVIDNKDKISEFISDLLRLYAIVQLVMFIFGIFASILIAVITPVIGLIAAISGLLGVFAILTSPLALTIILVAAIIGLFVGLMAIAFLIGQVIGAGILLAIAYIQLLWIYAQIAFTKFKNIVTEKVTAATEAITSKIGDWSEAGKNLIEGLVDGVVSKAASLAAAVADAVQSALDVVNSLLDSHSPSRVFMDIGENTMIGMAQGVDKMAGMVAGAMEGAIAQASMPALAMPSVIQNYALAASSVPSATYNNTNTMNLTINSAAKSEQLVQDYNMMRSVLGA